MQNHLITEDVIQFHAQAAERLGLPFLADAESGLLPASECVVHPVSKHAYQRINVPMSWHGAKEYCKRLGGHLATVTSDEENRFLFEHFGKDRVCWLGGTDEQLEGEWRWVTGEPWQYSNWFAGEPNNGRGTEHFIMFGNATIDRRESYHYEFEDKWNDHRATGDINGVFRGHAICEWDAPIPGDSDAAEVIGE